MPHLKIPFVCINSLQGKNDVYLTSLITAYFLKIKEVNIENGKRGRGRNWTPDKIYKFTLVSVDKENCFATTLELALKK